MNLKFERNSTADLLKGLAVIFMIQVHITELFANKELFYSFTGKMSLFLGGIPAAPIFMGIMGYFLAESKKSTVELIKRGVYLFLGGMLLNIGININLFIHIMQGVFDLNPFNSVFAVDIFHLAGISIILLAIIKDSLSEHYLIPFSLALLFAYLSDIFSTIHSSDIAIIRYITPYFGGSSEWSFFPLIPWVAYPLLGFSFNIFIKNNKLRVPITRHLLILCTIAWGLFLLITFDFGLNFSSNLQSYYHHSIVFTLWTIVALSGYVFILHYLNGKAKMNPVFIYLSWVGKNVTVMYVIQWLIIGNIATSIFRTQDTYSVIIWFIAITIFTSLLTFLFEKIRTKILIH